MIRTPITHRSRIILGVVSLVVLALSYTWLSYRQHQKNPRDTTIPTWTQLWGGVKKICTPDIRKPFVYGDDTAEPAAEPTGLAWLKRAITSTMLWQDASATFVRHFSGLAVGVLLSVVVGLAMGCYAPAEAFFLPPLSFLAKVPPTAIMAVFFVVVGLNFQMYVAMIAFGVLPTLAQAIYQAARNDVPEELVFKAYTLGASHVELIWNVIYKQVLPRIIEAVRLQVGPAMVYLIAAEMLVASAGFGYRIRMEQRLTHMDVVYVYLVILGLVGYLMDFSLSWLRKTLCPWFGK
ncbi:MAG: ABC transporter permease [Pirellulales bacterium]